MRGKLIYVVDEERIRKHKRVSFFFLIPADILFVVGLVYDFIYWDEVSKDPGINFPLLLFFECLFSIVIFIVLIYNGFRVQPFGIYERGIVPPLKPWSKMFSKEYFIPYERMEKIDTDRWKIVEKGGRKSNLRSWFLFNFVRSGKEADMVEEMLKKIAKRVNNGHTKEIKESELRG